MILTFQTNDGPIAVRAADIALLKTRVTDDGDWEGATVRMKDGAQFISSQSFKEALEVWKLGEQGDRREREEAFPEDRSQGHDAEPAGSGSRYLTAAQQLCRCRTAAGTYSGSPDRLRIRGARPSADQSRGAGAISRSLIAPARPHPRSRNHSARRDNIPPDAAVIEDYL